MIENSSESIIHQEEEEEKEGKEEEEEEEEEGEDLHGEHTVQQQLCPAKNRAPVPQFDKQDNLDSGPIPFSLDNFTFNYDVSF
jgi:hypothetical protein